MKVLSTSIEGVFIFIPDIFEDSRGYFFESYSKRKLDPYVGNIEFVQDNESCSSFGVVRGLHFQAPPFSQAKLVRCIKGMVKDIAVDIRKGSPTYGKYVEIILSEENKHQLFIPHGFAHGFEVLSDTAIFLYKCDQYYHPETESGINLFDDTLAIKWGICREKAILSEKDLKLPYLNDFESPFIFNHNV